MVAVFDDFESLSQAAAEAFVEAARAAVRDRRRFAAALSGGGTPQRTLALLAETPRRERTPWGQTHVFWSDERCAPRGDPRRNESMARAALLARVGPPEPQIHAIDCAGTPDLAARRYETELRNFFAGGPPRFDLIFLGLGDDGHTASLFSHSPALREAVHWTATAAAPHAGVALDRVTLTPAIINCAVRIIFLVAGGEKADALRLAVTAAADPDRCPATAICPHDGELEWFVDRDAARNLPAAACPRYDARRR